MGRWFSAMAAAAAVLGAAGAYAADTPSGKLGTVTLSRVAQKLPADKVWLTYQQGVLCVAKDRLKGDGVQRALPRNAYGPVFMRALAAAGRLDNSDRPNLFAEPTERQTVAYEIGALIHDVDIKLCGLLWGEASLGVKGKASAGVQWQIYSPAKREVVATIETTGSVETGRMNDGYTAADVAESAMLAAFLESAKQLVASAQFKALMDAPPPKDELRSTPGQQAKLSATGGSTPRSVSDTVGSVVLVSLPDSFGSGVLVSEDGYILTNAHVVHQSRTVMVRWSDGFEAEGQVIRVHAGRDVALVKTDPHGRQPVPLRTSALEVGEPVMAIGAPLEKAFQGTVTRGIVSAPSRLFEGYSFIQSDVTVNHGNSGGALIDGKGYLIGLADLGIQPEGLPTGINLFIPIKDAVDFVSLDLEPGRAPVVTPIAQKAAEQARPARR